MLDFHNHLIPGVDDGAASLVQALDGLTAMREEGVWTLITTPHFLGSLTLHPAAFAARMAELDAGWSVLQGLAQARFADLRVERGVEVNLDAPDLDLSDPRLRLGGSSFALVEFAHFSIPPRSSEILFQLKTKGVNPILAHPERYSGVRRSMELVEEWRNVGCHLQVNAGSLLGRYGSAPREAAFQLLARGYADYLSSDYHARGTPGLKAMRKLLLDAGGEEHLRLLTIVNPGRILNDEPPLAVPPLVPGRGWWRRLQKIFR
jgi:protein-tyrosine phosphatase